MPATLADVVSARIEGIDAEVREALLLVAALPEPGVELIEKAVGRETAALLERAEELRVIEIGGGRIRFTHPLLAAGVYAAASAAAGAPCTSGWRPWSRRRRNQRATWRWAPYEQTR